MLGFYIIIVCFVAFILWMWWELKHAPTVSEDYPDDKMEELINRLKSSGSSSSSDYRVKSNIETAEQLSNLKNKSAK